MNFLDRSSPLSAVSPAGACQPIQILNLKNHRDHNRLSADQEQEEEEEEEEDQKSTSFFWVNFSQIEKTRCRPKDLILEIRIHNYTPYAGGVENCQ